MSKNLALLQQDIVETRNKTSNIFNLPDLKRVVDNLDFNTSERMSRDGSKKISIHNKRMPNKNTRYRIFDFASRVTTYSNLSDGFRNEVIKYCATVIFYDHGYKSTKGISRLDRTWRIRMENSYISGADTRPLRGQQKGSRSYTDKFEEEHPGMIRKLYRYAEKTIGNQASYTDLANCMNEKAMVNPEMHKQTKFNTCNVREASNGRVWGSVLCLFPRREMVSIWINLRQSGPCF